MSTSTSVGAHALVRAYFAAVNERRLERFDDLVADDYRDHLPGQDRGREAVRGYFQSMIAAFPDLVMTIEHIVAEGDLVVAHNRLHGTHRGPLYGREPTGRRIDVEAFQLYRVARGRLAEHWEVADVAELVRQLAADGPAGSDRGAVDPDGGDRSDEDGHV